MAVPLIALGLAALPGNAVAKATHYKAGVEVGPAGAVPTRAFASGWVFEDTNMDGVRHSSEVGIGGVMVSNGREVVVTDDSGRYTIPAFNNMTLFITKPSAYDVPVNEDNVPQFSYHHLPAGSPPLRFGGLSPTGNQPLYINFPLVPAESFGSADAFKCIVSGDTQPYSNNEVGYVRDTLANELAGMEADDIECVIIEGDVMGDDLGLYDRFKKIMSIVDTPIYFVPGNHDLDFDAPTDAHSFDTFRREWGPTYYSLDIGQVHFVVLDDVKYPCTPEDNFDGLHPYCESSNPGYNGVITDRQMEWLANDLAHVPMDKLIVFNMHIPLQTFIDLNATRHQVDNAQELYDLLGCVAPGMCARKALALSGHTHTLEQLRPGEVYEGWIENTGALGARSPGAIPFPQIVTGAACGSWWWGDYDRDGVPMAFQRLGAPRGYLIFDFDGSDYTDTYKPSGQSVERQMSLSLLGPDWRTWYDTLRAWLDEPSDTRSDVPPVNINDMPDPLIVPLEDVAETWLTANIWNGSKDSEVLVYFGDASEPVQATRTQPGEGENIEESIDPYALQRQLMVARYAFQSESGDVRSQGFELYRGNSYGPAAPQPMAEGLLTDQSQHLWHVELPDDLGVGVYAARVVTTDHFGRQYEQVLTFEIVEERPFPYFRDFVFND